MASHREDRLQLALLASREGIWDWDLEAKSIYYSARVYRFMGYQDQGEEMPHLFEAGLEVMDEESLSAVNEALRRVRQEGEDLFAVEPRVKTRHGFWKWLRVRGAPVRDELGRVTRIAGSVIDITKRKQAENDLADERYLAEFLLDAIPMSVYFKDKESRIVMTNLTMAIKVGADSASELIGKTDADFFGKEHASRARANELEIMKTQKGQIDITERETWNDKSDSWVKSTKQVWLGAGGEVIGTYGVSADVSEIYRKKSEQEEVTSKLNAQNLLVEEERQQMRLVIDNVPLNIYFKDKNYHFKIVNKAMAEWMGVADPEELYGKSDRDFFSEEHWGQAEADELKIMETGEPMVGVVERETWGGRKDTWVMSSKYPWKDSKGEVVGTFGVSTHISDLITGQKKLEKLVRKYESKNREIQEELNLAREVQRALLPTEIPDVVSGSRKMSFYQVYRPGDTLSGDFFEVLPLGDGKVGFLIGEVQGEGVRSALILSMLRGLIEKQMSVAGDPGVFLTELNEGMAHLLMEAESGVKATAFYGVVDLDNSQIQLAVAGHASPIAVFEDGVRQLVLPPKVLGPALGENPSQVFDKVESSITGIRRLICHAGDLTELLKSEGGLSMAQLLEVVERGGDFKRVLSRIDELVVEMRGEEETQKSICLLGWEVEL